MAHRSELQGIHAILLALSTICQFHEILEGEVCVGCDNLMSVKESGCDFLKVGLWKANAVLIQLIWHLREDLSKTGVSFSQIHGHQDETFWFKELPHITQLSV